MTSDINELAKEVNSANKRWWQNPSTGLPIARDRRELLALVVTELAEALEGERKDLMDDHLPHRRMAEVEMADAKIRLLDYAAGFKVDLEDSVRPEGDAVPACKGAAIFWIMRAVLMAGTTHGTYSDGEAVSKSIRMINDYCVRFGYDLDGALREKLAYNARRRDHTHEARLAEGGKKFLRINVSSYIQ